jgi:hypothetical protein
MDMLQVFEEKVIKTTEQALKQTFEKLKKDELLKRKFRELAAVSRDLERLKYGLSSMKLDSEVKEKWIIKRDNLNKERDKLYSDIQEEGFENGWITTIVNNEMEKLDKLYDEGRKNAYLKVFGKVDIDDIDIMDDRWELVGEHMEKVKSNYFEGK